MGLGDDFCFSSCFGYNPLQSQVLIHCCFIRLRVFVERTSIAKTVEGS